MPVSPSRRRSFSRARGRVGGPRGLEQHAPHEAPVAHAPALSLVSPAGVAALQRSVGNVAVQRLLGFGKKKTKTAPVQGPKTERETFDASIFQLQGWQPSTKGGKFDVLYKPKDGVMHIIMKVAFNFKDVDVAYASQAANKKDLKWTASAKKDWTQKWIDAVMTKWGDIAPFTCDKPGFDDVSVKPQIEINVVKDPGAAHFKLDVTKAFEKQGGGMRAGGLSGVNREGTGAFQEQDAYDKINNPKIKKHLAETENKNNILPAYERDRDRLAKSMAGLAPVQFKSGSNEFADGGAAAAAAAQRILALRSDSALSDLHPITVNLALGDGEARSLLATRFQAIKGVLQSAGVNNPLSAKQGSDAPRSATFAAGSDSDAVKELYLKKWDRYTAAHEFGHMLGLLDEYCPAVSPDLIMKMVAEGAIDSSEQNLSKFAEGKKSNNKDEQTAYKELLDKTGLKTPTWARPGAAKEEKSTSLMSGGFEVLRQHHVTLWEALTVMTKQYVPEKNWKV